MTSHDNRSRYCDSPYGQCQDRPIRYGHSCLQASIVIKTSILLTTLVGSRVLEYFAKNKPCLPGLAEDSRTNDPECTVAQY